MIITLRLGVQSRFKRGFKDGSKRVQRGFKEGSKRVQRGFKRSFTYLQNGPRPEVKKNSWDWDFLSKCIMYSNKRLRDC